MKGLTNMLKDKQSCQHIVKNVSNMTQHFNNDKVKVQNRKNKNAFQTCKTQLSKPKQPKIHNSQKSKNGNEHIQKTTNQTNNKPLKGTYSKHQTTQIKQIKVQQLKNPETAY